MKCSGNQKTKIAVIVMNLAFRWPCIVIHSYNKTNYMFRTDPLSIIRSFSLYTLQWYMSYKFADSLRGGSGWNILILFASCQKKYMTYTIAVCTVKNSWWWTEELSETRRVLFQKYIWEIGASTWFYYKNLSRCTVIWMSKRKKVFSHYA